MKRKVRIYKAPNGQGGYINKTAQWLKKAEDGAEMTPVTAGIMQQMQPAQQQMMQQQTPQQDQSDMMLQQTTEMISRGMDKEEIKANLLAQYSDYEEGSPEYSEAEAQIDQYVESIYDQLGETAAEETNEDLGQDREEYQDPTYYQKEVQEANQPNYYYDLAEGDEESADSDIEEDYDFARYGGIPNKRSYVNKVIRQLRKAQKGDQVEEANTANVRGTEDNPTTNNPGNKNPFIAGVKGQAENHFLKQQAEQMYNNQFGQSMQQSQPQMDFAQFGGMRMRRANRRLFGTPFVPPGVTSSKYSFGPLGGVRSAEVQFNPLMMASMYPMAGFPMMGGFSSYGYMTPKKKYTTGRLVTEKVATSVNNKSTTDVAKATGSEAAKSSDKFDVVVGNPGKKVEFTPRQGEIVPVMNPRSIANTYTTPHPELTLQQMGGMIASPQQDQFGNLQRFVYGGDENYSENMLEDLYQPPINQSDLNYTDSKDTTDAFFRHGGLHRFDGTEDSETDSENAGKTYSQEELNKLLAEKQKSWETDYQKKYNQQMQRQQQMMSGYGGYGAGYTGGYNPYDSYSAWNSRGNYGGFGPYASTGLLGAAGNLIKGFGRGPSTFGPAGNPLQYAANAAAITKSGMLPTGMKYSKEKAEGFLGKLGLKNDKVWTLDYATPEQIKAGIKPGTTGATTSTPGAKQDTSNMSFRDKMINRRDERLNRNTPAESDAYQFTGTLTGSPTTSAKQPMSNEEMLKAQGRVWDEKQKKWLPKPTLTVNDPNATRTPGISPSQGANMVTGTPGKSVGNLPSQGMAYGGYIPEADQGINFSTVSYGPNSITQPGGIGQGQTGPCTEEEVKDPTSPCYDPIYAGQGPRVQETPQTAQLKIKEQKGPLDYTKASRGVLDFAANLADSKQYVNQLTNKILGLTEFSSGEKQSPNEVLAKGEFNARTGKEGIQGFEGIIRKGGAIKSKKSKASGHRINISDFQDLMRLAGLK